MNVSAISRIVSAPVAAPAPRPAVQASSSPAAPVQADFAADSVEISLASEIKLLESQGISLANIALQLGLDVKSVASYLPLTKA